MRGGNGRDDRQPEAGASAATRFEAGETIKDAAPLRRRYPGSAVGDGEFHHTARDRGSELHNGPGPGVRDRVGGQLHNGLGDALCVQDRQRAAACRTPTCPWEPFRRPVPGGGATVAGPGLS